MKTVREHLAEISKVRELDKAIEKTGGLRYNLVKSENVAESGVQKNESLLLDQQRRTNSLEVHGTEIGVLQESAESKHRTGNEGSKSESGRSGKSLGQDSEGRRLSEKIIEILKKSSIKNENGEPIPLYHFTPKMSFKNFMFGDIGFHFGTIEQAFGIGERWRNAALDARANIKGAEVLGMIDDLQGVDQTKSSKQWTIHLILCFKPKMIVFPKS